MTEELPAEPPAAPPAVRADQDPGQEADGQVGVAESFDGRVLRAWHVRLARVGY